MGGWEETRAFAVCNRLVDIEANKVKVAVLVFVLLPFMPACVRYKQHGNSPGHIAMNELLQLRANLPHGVGHQLPAALGAEAESVRFVNFAGVQRYGRDCWNKALKLPNLHLPGLYIKCRHIPRARVF